MQMELWNELWRDTLDVLIPQRCVGCGAQGESVCDVCSPGLTAYPVVPEFAIRRELFGVPTLSAWHYSGVRRDVIVAFKDSGVISLAPHLVTALRDTLAHLRPHLPHSRISLIPVPSSTEGWLARGREPVAELARRLAIDPSVCVAPVLRRAEGPFSLRGLSRGPVSRKVRSRRERIEDPPRFLVRGDLPSYSLVLFDDVVTTGTTLEAAARALAVHGCVVSAVLTVAYVAQSFLGNPQVTGSEARTTLEKSGGLHRLIA